MLTTLLYVQRNFVSKLRDSNKAVPKIARNLNNTVKKVIIFFKASLHDLTFEVRVLVVGPLAASSWHS